MQTIRGTRILHTLVLTASLALTSAAYAGSSPPMPASTNSYAAGANDNGTPSAGAMAFDLVLVRPLGLVATVVGSALFIANLPLSVFEQDAPAQPFQRLVVDPLNYTFRRPLGQMN